MKKANDEYDIQFPIKNLEWNDESFKVNGVEIKTNHKKKYQELHDKYLNKRHHVGKVE